MKLRIGFLHTLIRPEEKYLINELGRRRNVELVTMDTRKHTFRLGRDNFDFDLIFVRCINQFAALPAVRLFEAAGIKCLNSSSTAVICGDKKLTSITLMEEKIPQPEVCVAFTPETAVEAIEQLGYPVVLKPAVGSWGRLLAKVNDRQAAEALLEHKAVLGSEQHSIFYIQKYVPKNGRDIRVYVVGGRCITAIYRSSDHWITNMALGAKAAKCPVTDELNDIAVKAAKAVEGGIVGVDIFETDNGYLVNELNCNMEFRLNTKITGVNVPEAIIDYVVKTAEKENNGKY